MLIIQDYWAAWCGPCKVMAPLMDEIAREYVGKVGVEKIDVDKHQDRAVQAGVQSIPTPVFMKNGKEVDRVIGAQSKDILVRLLDKHLA